MGCCGGGNHTAKVGNAAAMRSTPPVVTGYAIELADGRVITFATRAEADAAHEKYRPKKPVREVLGWR